MMSTKRPASAAVGDAGARRPPSGTSRTRPRSASRGDGGNGGANREVEALQDQLRAVLRRIAEVDEEHQRGVVAYRHRLRRMYGDNAALRNIIAGGEARRRRAADGGASSGASAAATASASAPATVTEAECESLQLRINLATRKLNMLRHDLEREEGHARAQQAAVEEAEQVLQNPLEHDLRAGGSGAVFLRTQRMERRLDAVMMQQGSVGVVLHGYDHHLQALTAESRRYEGRTGHLEGEYVARHRDHLQLARLYQRTMEQYSKLSDECVAFMRNLERLRGAKEQALAEKTAGVATALRRTEEREQRLSDLQLQLEDAEQHLEYAEHLRGQAEQRVHMTRSMQDLASGPVGGAGDGGGSSALLAGGDGDGELTAEEEERLVAFENAFRAMLRVSRVSRLEDLVGAYESEHVACDGLRRQVAEARARHAALEAQVKEVRHRHEVLQGTNRAAAASAAAGAAASAHSGKLLGELRMFVQEEAAALQQHRGDNEDGRRQLLEVARRVDALVEKMAAYRPDVAIPAAAESTLVSTAQGRAVLLGQLAVLKQKILALAEDAAAAAPTPNVVRSTQIVVPGNNIRVPLRPNGGGGHRRQQQPAVGSAASPTAVGGSSTGTRRRRVSSATAALEAMAADVRRGGADDEADDGGWGAQSDDEAASARSGSSGDGRADARSLVGCGHSFGDADGISSRASAASGSEEEEAADAAWHDGRGSEPLRREDVKRLSAGIQKRERRRMERERRNAE